jgi:hypothetical protein
MFILSTTSIIINGNVTTVRAAQNNYTFKLKKSGQMCDFTVKFPWKARSVHFIGSPKNIEQQLMSDKIAKVAHEGGYTKAYVTDQVFGAFGDLFHLCKITKNRSPLLLVTSPSEPLDEQKD